MTPVPVILKFFKILSSVKDTTVIKGSFRLEEPNFDMKTYGQRAFLLLLPDSDCGKSSPLKFELVLMLIF